MIDLQDESLKEHSVDIRGEQCPRTFVKAKIALEEIGVGDILNILLDNTTALENLPRAFMYQGQEYLGTRKVSDTEWVIRIRRKR
jgi:tRNA 2-thiouridine synthesizing protein A